MKYYCLLFLFLLSSYMSFAQQTFWGMSCHKGAIAGSIFKVEYPGAAYTDVHTFSQASNGINPRGSLIQASDGNLYGLCSQGGSFGAGVLFKFNPFSLVYTKLYDFDSLNGKNPQGTLLQASNGKLYGVTYAGGMHNRGILFEFDINSQLFSKKKDLVLFNVANPYGALIEISNGILYGLSSVGGVDGTGSLYEYNINTNTISSRYSFVLGPSQAGYTPRGALLQAKDGILYGLSRYGKPGFESGGGVIFKYDPAINLPWLAFSSLHVFEDEWPGSLFGYELMGSLIQASDGKLYGMTRLGGAYAAGTIFAYDTALHTCSKVYDFNSSTDGYRPYGSLMLSSDGDLYGLTSSDSGQAKMFRFNIQNQSLSVQCNITGTPYYTSLTEIRQPAAAVPETEAALQINLFPNPCQNSLHITFPDDMNIIDISILDAAGRTVQREPVNVHTLQTRELKAGMYYLKIRTAETTMYRKFHKLR